jgi:hypothetical protein
LQLWALFLYPLLSSGGVFSRWAQRIDYFYTPRCIIQVNFRLVFLAKRGSSEWICVQLKAFA